MDMDTPRRLNDQEINTSSFTVAPQVLVRSFIEKAVKFAGVVDPILLQTDVTNRTDVLRIIDRGKAENTITDSPADVVLVINAQQLQLMDRGRDIFLEISMIHIAAVCYIHEKEKHILGMKFGDPRNSRDECKLLVLYCSSEVVVQEICSLINQCFQLLYTSVTMKQFDDIIRRADSYSHTCSEDDEGSVNLRQRDRSSRSYSSFTSSTRRTPASESDANVPKEIIRNYMKQLQKSLSPDELKSFAQLLKEWHSGMPFAEFCQSVLQLYGPERKHLLAGMNPFVPKHEVEEFERLLKDLGVDLVFPISRSGTDTMSLSSRQGQR